jgi:hypothetical protein
LSSSISGGTHPDRLDVDELADAIAAELAAITRLLESAEGQARVASHQAVDEYRAGVDLADETLGAPEVGGPECSAED